MHNTLLKKVLASAICFCMLCGVLGGCGNTPSSSGTVDNGNGDKKTETTFTRNENGYPDLKGTTFKIWFTLTPGQTKFCTNLKEYAIIQQLEKDLNCKFEFSHPPLGQEKDNFSIMLAGGEWPDIIFGGGISYYPGGIGSAMADGVMYDVTPYINETNTPNFLKKIMKNDGIKKWFMDDDSRITKLGSKISGSAEADIDFFGPMVRKDYLNATGMESPVTIDDWHKMLTKMKSNGVEYPLALNGSGWQIDRSCNLFASAYEIALSYYVKEDGKTVGYGMGESNYKGYLTTLNQWYTEKLINPDFPTQTMDDTHALLASGKTGAMVAHLYDYGSKYYNTNEKLHPEQALIGVQYPVLKVGDKLSRVRPSSLGVNDEKTITTKAKNPLACIYLLDALYIDEINKMMSYGVEGKGYNMVNGEVVEVPLTEEQPKEMHLQVGPGQWHTTEDQTLKGVLAKYKYGSDEQAIKLWGKCTTEGNLPTSYMSFTTQESEVNSKYQTELNTYVDEMMLKFITGVEPLSNFDKYIAQLEAMHLSNLLEVRQAAFDRYNKR